MYGPDDVGPKMTHTGPVEYSPEERQAIADRWNANDAAEEARDKRPELTLADLYEVLKTKRVLSDVDLPDDRKPPGG